MALRLNTIVICSIILLGLSCFLTAQTPNPTPQRPSTLRLEDGFTEFETNDFRLKLVNSSQTVSALEPKNGNGFDFTPADRLDQRSSNGFYHLGDITFKVRFTGEEQWRSYSSSAERKPVLSIPPRWPDMAAADLSPTLPADCPVQVIRHWKSEKGQLVLEFELKNKTDRQLELGSLGIPLVFNNILSDRNLIQSNEICSFSEPYVGMNGGYLQVSRLKGTGPVLIVVPDGRTPFEAYQLLPEPMRVNQTFEGTFEWLVHSQANAETQWKNAIPWNPPTMETLEPKETRSFGLRFLLADQVRTVDSVLAKNGRPAVVGIPGYILPENMEGKLLVKHNARIKNIEVEPKNSLIITSETIDSSVWQAYKLKAFGWGRVRLTINYADGIKQTIHYYLTKSAENAVADFGNFLFTRQWFDDPSDPFRRSPSVMSYDRETNKIVSQDSRVWIAGLGDEGGSGSWLAAGMKQFIQPNRSEIEKFERFIDEVLWGGLQYKEGENKFGVKKSLFYHGLEDFPYDKQLNWTTWTSWKKGQSETIGRGYNYPHVIAAYWSMYRIARNQRGLVKHHRWEWYLEQAFQTTRFLFGRRPDGKRRVDYVELGLMEGTIFLELLKDLKREGLTEKASEIEMLMKERADLWNKEAYPFGSEMAWDSTGQEEIYAWCKYFGFSDKATITLNSIIGYTPTVPHWGYNGNARRYWDFLYGGKLRRIERQIHHYGSGLNSIPLLAEFREHPDDFYLLRTGYGGMMGALSNIDRDGFASAAFHTFPDTLNWDAYSGDYGPNFFGHSINTGTYVIDHPEFGWQAFGGNVELAGDLVRIIPRDSMRQRVFIGPFGLWLTLDAGKFETVEINLKTKTARIEFSAKNENTNEARMRIEQTAKIAGLGKFRPKEKLKIEREAFVIPLDNKNRRVEIKAN